MAFLRSGDLAPISFAPPPLPPRLVALGRRLPKLGLALVLPTFILCVWQGASLGGFMRPQTLPSPEAVALTLVDLLRGGDIGAAFAASARRLAAGFALGGSAGFLFGLWLGMSRRAEAYLGPLLRAFASVPSLGWLPIFILIFGIEETLKIVIVAKAVFVPMALQTIAGVRAIAPAHVEAARVMRLRRITFVRRLVIPASLPDLFTGLRLALSHAFVALVVVEMLAGTDGIGYLMTWGRTLFQTDVVMSGMIVVGVTGFVLDRALARIEWRIVRAYAPERAA